MQHTVLMIEQRVREWLEGPYDEASKEEIRRMTPAQRIDAFYTDLGFGTGGMRGLMGAGTNRMNRYTVRKATQGLATYLKKPSHVVIGYDSRHHSKEFALEAARVLAGNGIGVYLLKELRPTPFVSFACRYLGCGAGIMITASHNPKEYNGYKVYWSDGAQVVHPHDVGIIKATQDVREIRLAPENDSHIIWKNGELDQAYLDAIRPLQTSLGSRDLKIAYTPLHGTGITLTPKALSDWGFTNIHLVKEQTTPDGDFPTVKFPNPEYPETLQVGIETMEREECDLLIANDPDADRMGVVVRHQGKSVILTGNQVAAIIAESLASRGSHRSNETIVTTIVTTELLRAIAKRHHLGFVEVLTGFKYIGEKIHEWEKHPGGPTFLFGAEESYGYLVGTHARDKDAVVCSCVIAEIALRAKQKGHTLVDNLQEIYRTYGVFKDKQLSLDFKPGKEGADQIHHLMERLRKNPPDQIGGTSVKKIYDLLEKTTLNLPISDVLIYHLTDGTRVVIRPSGTEPKVKIYCSIPGTEESRLQELSSALRELCATN